MNISEQYDSPVVDMTISSAIDIAMSMYTKPGNNPDTNDEFVSLTNLLYRNWYTLTDNTKKISPLPFPDWTQAYKVAHADSYQWESGWRIKMISSTGRVIAQRDDEERILYPGDYIPEHSCTLSTAPGSAIRIVSRIDSSEEQPGFWIAYAKNWTTDNQHIIRLYWNTCPEGAIRIVHETTSRMPGESIYSLKLPVDLQGYQRADSVVLYMTSEVFQSCTDILHDIYASCNKFMFSDTPGFTRKLQPGLALAEDPDDKSVSFGLHRCQLLAEGFIKGFHSSAQSIDDIHNTIKSHLLTSGLDLHHPYLNPGSSHDYTW